MAIPRFQRLGSPCRLFVGARKMPPGWQAFLLFGTPSICASVDYHPSETGGGHQMPNGMTFEETDRAYQKAEIAREIEWARRVLNDQISACRQCLEEIHREWSGNDRDALLLGACPMTQSMKCELGKRLRHYECLQPGRIL